MGGWSCLVESGRVGPVWLRVGGWSCLAESGWVVLFG